MSSRSHQSTEMQLLEGVSNAAMIDAIESAREQARAAYDVGDRKQWAQCVYEHMTPVDRRELATASVYRCPQCQNLLKRRPGNAEEPHA